MPSERAERYVLFPICDQLSWTTYKDLLHDFWTVEDYASNLQADLFACYPLYQLACAWTDNTIHTKFMSALCNAALASEARMFWGLHMMRYNLRFEAFQWIAANAQAIDDGNKYDVVDRFSTLHMSDARSGFLAQILPLEPTVDDYAALSLIAYCIFCLGPLAVLDAIRAETQDPFLQLVERIASDIANLMSYILRRYERTEVHVQWLSHALEIERAFISDNSPPDMERAALEFFNRAVSPMMIL